MVPFAPEGYPFVLVPALAGIFAWVFGYQPLAVVLIVVMLGCVAFFRDPRRTSDAPPEVVLAPADGKVLSVGPAPAPIAGRGLSQQISIFMSPANVHVNRAPVGGIVREVRTVPGTKLPAFRDKASDLNEHSFVLIEGHFGAVAYKQIAGAVARRVVCDLKPGQAVQRGERVGLIKFGSRVDLFLPGDAVVEIAPGQRTRAGITAVARLERGARS
ncbi:MAG: phosphatidylserine decarboxylase [Acidobacteriia bacterium]|nr:phosphatidylserine decarboxylase [Terriglobia bacterium]